MKRAITSLAAAAALAAAIAFPAAADPGFILTDIQASCQSGELGRELKIPDGPPGEVHPAIAAGFREADCDPGTRSVSYRKEIVVPL